jgi:hypothetical protein
MLKRLIYFILGLLILLIIAVVLVPVLFKGELQDLAINEINKNINAKLTFDEVNVSLIKSFPDFSVCLENYEIQGIEEFEGIPLAKGKSICVDAHLWSVLNKSTSIKVKSISLEEPNLNIVVSKNGNANYDITKPTQSGESTTESNAYKLNLEKYEIENGSFSYIDKASGLYMHAESIDHDGIGNFTSSIFDLITKTEANNVIFSSGGINYLSRARMKLDAIFNIDLDQSKYTLKENDLLLNALKMKADGFVQTKDSDIKMDLVFSTPTNSLKELISLVPGAYTKDYNNVEASGAVSFKGFAKGTYNGDKELYPEFAFDINVKDGKLKYPDLPLGLSAINSDILVKSPSSNFDDMVLNIKEINLKIGDEPFEGRLLLKTPLSDPDIDTKMKGIINLAQFAKAFPMEGVDKISGIIDTDFEIKTKMSTLDKAAYADANMKGKFAISNMNYDAKGYPPILINQMQVDFIPQFLKVNQFDAQLGKSDIKASGKIDNFLAWFSPEKTMKGNMVIRSSFFDADEWMTDTNETTNNLNTETKESETETEVFDRFDFTLDTKVDKIKYASYDLRNNIMKGHFTPNAISLDNFQTEIGKSDFKGRGKLSNVFGYLFNNEVLDGAISLNSDFIDANQFMTETSDEGQAKAMANKDEIEPFKVPENIDIDLTADIGKLLYTDIDARKVKGLIEIKDEAMKMNKVNMKTLGGNMNISGLYNSKDTDEPKFELVYSVDRLNFRETFEKFNTFQILMPIAKFLDGDFSTDMSFNGLLGKDMLPNLNTLNAEGFIQTFNAILNNFEPLTNVGEKLNLKWLKKINIDDSKNWFSIKDGKVVLEDTKHKIKNIEMLVGGTHGFESDMAYTMKAKIPKELMGNNAVTQAANKGLDFLNKEASKIGVNIANGDFVNVLIDITGTMKSPKIKITPTGTEGQTVKDIAKNVVNQVKETVKDTVTKVVTKVVDDTKEKLAAEKAKLEAEADAKIKKIKETARKQVDRARSEAKKRADQAKALAYSQADKLVEKASGNPFKKLAAQEGAKIAKKKADDIHKASLSKVSQTTEKINNKANEEADKIRAQYDAKISALEKRAGM